ncbi:phage holin family protein [Sphingomicrobium aestuariivivum]|uniref:phage holin family protein n=1 Tax=Sphingomicrobium aestuariivivum TaxID=1582356 RepID=UPI001FD6B6E1|nr:phage holin family protein [Sphingomicrobium aestuariivivum]MCJ8191500.1 phage holin family protein [Sphingomicrobium aestuariivivum]
MVRMLVQALLSLVANAVGLLAAAAFLDGFSIGGMAFVVAVGIFTLVTIVMGPLILKTALASARYLVGGIALVTTLVGLLLTEWLSDGIEIDGAVTLVLATLIVWVFSVLANVLLPLILFRKVLEQHRD